MTEPNQRIIQIVRNDPRYPIEAYEFILAVLELAEQRKSRLKRQASKGQSPQTDSSQPGKDFTPRPIESPRNAKENIIQDTPNNTNNNSNESQTPCNYLQSEGLDQRSPSANLYAKTHVTGQEIVLQACQYANAEFGYLAKTVFHQWGIRRTDDLGEIVFNLIEAELLTKNDTDSRADFQNVLDLDRSLTEGYTITVDPVIWSR